MSIRRFHLLRTEDASGISGCGIVAEGVEFSDKKVALEWLSEHASTNLYESIADVEFIHGHEGRTKIVFDDPESDEDREEIEVNE